MNRETYVPDNPHVLGNVDAPFTIVEFGDMECPDCNNATQKLRKLVAASAGKVRLVWRHFPLFEVHPHALTAALAAEATGDKFWQMQELLFANQDQLTDEDLANYAQRLGVDGERVVGDAAQVYAPIIERDYTLGLSIGVPGTPTLYVNGEHFYDRISLAKITGL